MSFGYSLADFVAITLQIDHTVDAINSGGAKNEFGHCSRYLVEVRDAIRRIERAGLDYLDEKEAETLRDTAKGLRTPLDRLYELGKKYGDRNNQIETAAWESLQSSIASDFENIITPGVPLLEQLAANAEG